MRNISRSLFSVLTAVGLFSSAAVNARADDLTIATYGGAFEEALRAEVYDPFTKDTGINVLADAFSGDVGKIRAMANTGTYNWQLAESESVIAAIGCQQDFLERFDLSRLNLKESDFVPGSLVECGIPDVIYSVNFAYDSNQVAEPGPQSWADFWDVKKWPGKRAMRKSPNGTLEFALIADGVPMDKVYETLKTPEGVDRAFASLSKLKPNIVWWETGAQSVQLIADKEVAMTVGWNGRLYAAAHNEGQSQIKTVWNQFRWETSMWIMPKGAPNVDNAYKFLAYATKPELISKVGQRVAYGLGVVAANELIPAELNKELPTSPDNLKNGFPMDVQFWVDHQEDLTERFNSWVAQQ
ncbi:ABC transporter substrate-binding protein [Ensifer aridi]|uniref:ABC transporter substrate-binding protein n=1 Tax=Ensifer aridi TaxID=1708715 RepID=UPI000A12171A|nr:ABC transporter substrate-binding protein [Ensifer aridi]